MPLHPLTQNLNFKRQFAYKLDYNIACERCFQHEKLLGIKLIHSNFL